MAAEDKRDASRPCRVILTLENVLLPLEQLKVTPSMIDGISKQDETSLRILGCDLVQTAGILLKLPQVAMATGQVVFHRFYYSKSLVKHGFEVVSMASIYLAAKIEESPRRLRDIINVFNHIKQVRLSRAIRPLVLDNFYVHMKNQVIKAERRLLKELGFCVHVKHPHKIVVAYLQILEQVENRFLTQYAWNLMNDGLRTDMFVRYSPEAIACACIFLAARKLRVPLPESPPWYALFDVDYRTIVSISKMLIHLYSLPKPDSETLEKLCEETKQQQQEEKRKAKIGVNSVDDASNPASRTDSPNPKNTSSPVPSNLKKIKSEDGSRLENGSSGEKNGQRGKRHHEDSENSHTSRSRSSRSHSHSVSPPSKKKRSYSRSLSPLPKKKRYSPVRRHKRDRYDDYDEYSYKEKRSHKHRKRARSRSPSVSPRYSSSKSSKKSLKDKRRSYSPIDRNHRSRKHHNGQHDYSPRYDKRRK